MKLSLENIGWNNYLNSSCFQLSSEIQIGRIDAIYKNISSVLTPSGIVSAKLPGKSYHQWESLPAVGDFVEIKYTDNDTTCIINKILPRVNILSRKVSGKKTEEQLIASNIDYVFIVQSLDYNFNIRRLERYLAMTQQAGIRSIILLNKADLCSDIESIKEIVKNTFDKVDCHFISCKSGYQMDSILSYFKTGITTCFLGSSGVGKSSIINWLANSDLQDVNRVRDSDSKGRHTTTTRQLLLLQNGGMVIDTPGMRELQLWDGDMQLDSSFTDIQDLSFLCQFRNCKHESEPGCNVIKAVESGKLEIERLNNYKKLKKESEYLYSRQTKEGLLDRKKSKKNFSIKARKILKSKKKTGKK